LESSGSESPFTRIPVDVVLEIADHLDNVSVASLTLTCWDLYNIPDLSPRRQHLNRLEIISLLLLLEKRRPVHLFVDIALCNDGRDAGIAL
jgi:hypothetical protein